MLLHSVRVGNEAVAGGKSISTTGIDPISGKVSFILLSLFHEL